MIRDHVSAEKVKEESRVPVNAKRTFERILRDQIDESTKEYQRSNRSLFLSGLTAGLDLGFSLLVMSILYALFVDQVSASALQVIVAMGYSVGFIFVVLGGSVLFTEHTTLATLPVLDGRNNLRDLARIWAIIYGGNILGGYLFGGTFAWLGPALEITTIDALIHLAEKTTGSSSLLILGSATLAGWLMGLLSWMVTSTRDTISELFIIIIITGVIGLGGFHHSIVGSTELFTGMLISDTITFLDYLRVQGLATLGNILGGVFFVGILKFQVAKDEKPLEE